MNAYKLIATVTAVLLTFVSVSVINYNVAVQPAVASSAQPLHVTQFAPIHVYPSAAELRQTVALATDADSDTMVASASGLSLDDASASFKLVGSALAVPHYSFGQKSGRVSKE